MTSQPLFYYRVKVSQLAHFRFCPKRCKLEVYKLIEHFDGEGHNYMQKGNEMHFAYSCPYKSFDRRLLRYKILIDLPLKRVFENCEIRGIPDDFRVLFNSRTKEKWVSVLEVKTTNKPHMWIAEQEAAVFQLQLYIWILEPILTKLGYKLGRSHYVEIYSQKDGKLLKRIPVTREPEMEERLRYIFRSFQGLEKWTYPEDFVCKICPKNVKEKCDRWMQSHTSNI